MVAENGIILGVSDMLNSIDGNINPGHSVKTYETKRGKIGVCIGNDLYFPDVMKTFAYCGAETVLCPVEWTATQTDLTLIRAYSFLYGVPVCLIGEGYSAVSGIDGTLQFSSPLSPVGAVVEQKKEFHLVETRHKGFYKNNRSDY